MLLIESILNINIESNVYGQRKEMPNRVIFHDIISEVVKPSCRAVWLIFLQVSNTAIKHISIAF